MKNVIFLAGVAVWLFFQGTLPVSAETFTVHGDEYAYGMDSFSAFMDELPEELQESLGEISLYQEDLEDNTASLLKQLSFQNLWNQLVAMVKERFLPFAGVCTTMCGMLLVTAMMQQLTGENPFADMCAELVMALVIYTNAAEMFTIAEEYMVSLCTVMNRMLPVLAAVSYGTGEITMTTVQHSGMLLFITILSSINTYLFQPMCKVLFSLTIVSSVCTEISISGILAGVRRFFLSLFSFFILLYSFVYGIQTSLARSADSLGLRTVKFALGSFIPLVGGVVSEAFSAVREGLYYVRAMTGIGGIVVLIFLLMPTGISLFLMKLSFQVSHMAAEILGCRKSAKWLSDASSILQILTAMVWLSTIFFLFAMILYIKTAVHAE